MTFTPRSLPQHGRHFGPIVLSALLALVLIAGAAQEGLPQAAPPFAGTVYIDPDIITASDPTTFQGVTAAGRGVRTMFDRRVDAFVAINAYLFDATFDDGLSAEIQVNPEFASSSAAMAEAEHYARIIGQLPTALRVELETVWIHKGDELLGGGNNNILIHTDHAEASEQNGFLEEELVHEGAHTSLDAAHADTAAWRLAQTRDGGYISTYARDFPDREDIAESFLPYLAVRYRPERISSADEQAILNAIPNRIAYFDAQSFDMYPIVAREGSDAFGSASAISGASGVATGSNVGAGKESGEPDHAGNRGGASLWWSWTAPASSMVTIDTQGSDFDTLLAVYTGSSVDALTIVASNDDAIGLQSEVSFTAQQGVVYHIAVDGYSGATGSVVLGWDQDDGSGTTCDPNLACGAAITCVDGLEYPTTCGPLNCDPPIGMCMPVAAGSDSFALRSTISGASGVATGSNVGAGRESGEPDHAGNRGGASLWWSWTAPASGMVTIDTQGSDFDTLLAVYTGSSVDALTIVASNDDAIGLQSEVSFTAQQGVVYHIAVDGYSGATGSVVLGWSQSDDAGPTCVPDPNLACTTALTCFNGLLYPTGCGPLNCDLPVGTCETEEPVTGEALASVTLSTGAVEVDEGDDRTPVAVTLRLSHAVTGDVTIALASTGSAQLGSDFDLTDTVITVPGGNTQAATMLTPIRDLEAEGDETIRLEIDSVAGRGEIGASAAVHVDIRDLGVPSPDDYAVLEAFMLLLGGETYDIDTDELYLTYIVRNTGRVAASPTEAILLTTTDLFSDADPVRRLATRPVPALEPSGSRFVDTIRVAFDDLVAGSNNYLALVVRPVAEEDPDLVGSNRGGALDYTAVFLSDGDDIPTTCAGFERDTEPGTPDPLFTHQWALRNSGQAAFAASGGVAGQDLNMVQTLAGGPTGAGVQVAVVDTGLETCHPDLAANVEPGLSYNFSHPYWLGARADDPFLPTVLGDHGTSVAGLIAAAADNGIGGRGVAPEARLRGFNFLSFPFTSAYFAALGMSSERPQADDVDIFNMSFGSSGSASGLSADERELFRVGVSDLRDGRGALYVKAAGNDFGDCTKVDDDGQPVAPRLDLSTELGCFAANRDGENNLPYVIVTGGFSADGRRSSYASAGAALWVVAPAGQYGSDEPAMITTDQMGGDRGYVLIPVGLAAGGQGNPQGDYTSIFNGTSAAAPNTSGAVALLLETQPELTWRDVKHILATTARPLHTDIPRVRVAFGGVPAVLQHGWITNAAGYPFHNWYGFGAVDVDAAVALAAVHAPDSLGVFTESAPLRLATGVAIPDHDGGGLTQTQNVTGLSRTANIEAVQLRVEVTHDSPRELGFELTSPAGTRSVINPVFNEALYGVDNPLDWTILSNAFYGEPPTGQWTLNVIDAAAGSVGTLDAWSLIFYMGEHPEDG